MELRNIMTRDVVSVSRTTSLQEAANIMKQYNIGSIPVCDNGKVIGIITDRDIVIRNVTDGSQPSGTICEDVMTPNPILGTPDMDVHEAARIMGDNQIRRLPVVENGRLSGMVAIGDLAVEPKFENEAGDALNDISKPGKPMM